MSGRHDHEPLRIATIPRGWGRGKAKNISIEWGELRKRLSNPIRDMDHSQAQYQRLSADAKARIKDVGAFVGGPFIGGKRRRDSIKKRSLLTLDVDSATPAQIDILRMGISGLADYEWLATTTRSHTAESPRWRIVIPLARMVNAEDYGPLARIAASKLFPSIKESMDATDDVSYRVAQIMYWPSVCYDGLFEVIHNPGDLLDPYEMLEDFGDWQDWTQLPYSEKRGQKRPAGKKAEDPRTKAGLIGAFCRAYDIESAIEKFIPDVYVPSDDHGAKPRYTYVAGSTANGAVVEDGGLFLYSHHGTDPCGDRLVNAWDMVRIHKFGHLDEKHSEDTSPSKLPSFRAMVELAQNDPKVMDEAATEAAHIFDDLGKHADEEPRKSKGRKEQSRDRDADEGEEETPKIIRKMNQRHAVAFIKGKTVIITEQNGEVDLGTPTDLNAFYENQRIPTAAGSEPISKYWMRHPERRTYPRGVVFAPGREVEGALNLWKGFAVEPDRGASCDRLLRHLREVICRNDEAIYRWVLGWLAHMVQKPWEKPGSALVLRGKKGAGKDTLGYYVGAIFPQNHTVVHEREHFLGRFNFHLAQTLLLQVEEGFWAGDKNAEGKIKSIITSPSMLIEPKGITPFKIDSFLRVLISSNEDWVVPATSGERRFCVLDVSDAKRKQPDWFGPIYEEMENGGPAALLHFLLNFDISDFDPRNPPKTEGLANQISVGLRGVPRWWLECLEDGEIVGLVFSDEDEEARSWQEEEIRPLRRDLMEAYHTWLRHRRYDGERLTPSQFGIAIRELLPDKEQRGQRRVGRYYRIARLDECREYFERAILGGSHPWPDD